MPAETRPQKPTCPLHRFDHMVWMGDHWECGQCLDEAEDATWD